MSGKICNGWLRSLVTVGAVVAAVVVFAWRSQAGQNTRIGRNETAVAVIDERLKAIVDKLDEIKALVKER